MDIRSDRELIVRKRILYVKWAVIAVVLVVLMFFYEKPYEGESVADVVGKISNCFTVPGIVLSGIGALSYVSYIGGYDSFGYIFSNFALHSLIYREQPKKYQSLYDYKQAKDAKGRKWLPHVLFVGLGTLAISVVLLIVYAFL